MINYTITGIDGLTTTNDMVAIHPNDSAASAVIVSRYSFAREFNSTQVLNFSRYTYLSELQSKESEGTKFAYQFNDNFYGAANTGLLVNNTILHKSSGLQDRKEYCDYCSYQENLEFIMMEPTVLDVSHGGHCIIEINGKLISNYIQAPLGITWNGALQYTFSPGTYKIRMSIGRGSLPGPI